MSNLLEPAELEALMGEMQPSADGGSAGSQDSRDRYDFATQDYAVQRLIPALSLVQTQFAEALKLRLRQLVPGMDNVRAERVNVMKFGELQRTLLPPCDISVISAQPLAAPMYLVFEPDLVFSLVDHFFGGRGNTGGKNGKNQSSPTQHSFHFGKPNRYIP